MNLKNQRLKIFLILSSLIVVLINFNLISAYLISIKYGSLTLNPGEKYILNIPFIGYSKTSMICGKAEEKNGTFIKNISVIVKYYNNETILAKNNTNSNGEYCINLPEINSSKKLDIYLEYDNSTFTLGNNGYELNFEDNKVYNKISDKYAVLTGNITNYDARIENGRFEVKVGYKEDSGWKYNFGDYEKYLFNIAPNEVYTIPNEEINISWKIPDDALTGQYKFLIKTSFNGIEKVNQYVYFNITE